MLPQQSGVKVVKPDFEPIPEEGIRSRDGSDAAEEHLAGELKKAGPTRTGAFRDCPVSGRENAGNKYPGNFPV